MTAYRRSLVPGGAYFFTVNLADRQSRLLVEYIELLRAAFREVRRQHPFSIDAIVCCRTTSMRFGPCRRCWQVVAALDPPRNRFLQTIGRLDANLFVLPTIGGCFRKVREGHEVKAGLVLLEFGRYSKRHSMSLYLKSLRVRPRSAQHQAALAVEQDEVLAAEMAEREEAAIEDGFGPDLSKRATR